MWFHIGIMKPIYVGKLTEKETKALEKGLKSSSAFTVRCSQILLKSAKGEKAQEIASQLHCSDQAVRNTIRAYQQQGLACLQEKSHARHDQQAAVDEQGSARLKEIVRLSPRNFDYETSVWTRPMLAEVLHQEGYTSKVVSVSTISATLQRVGISWRRAKQWVHSPDPHYQHRKKDEIS
jgi:transposase